MHPLQRFAPPERLAAALRRVLTAAVCAVGVDLNRCAMRPHASAPLAFVCGLGPRKADALLRRVRDEGLVPNRRQLAARGLLGPGMRRRCGCVDVCVDGWVGGCGWVGGVGGRR